MVDSYRFEVRWLEIQASHTIASHASDMIFVHEPAKVKAALQLSSVCD